jgi:hypothetical protein
MKCPGQDMQYWKPGDIFETKCPSCGHDVEFFKDEARRKCRACGTKIMNPRMDFGCASYCKYASECLGEMAPELISKRNDFFKDRVALKVKESLGNDFSRIAHVLRVARYTEQMAREEKMEPALVLCAAYLHALEHRANANGKDDASHDEAKRVLTDLGADRGLIEGVKDLLHRMENGEPGDSKEAHLLIEAHRLAHADERTSTEREDTLNVSAR